MNSGPWILVAVIICIMAGTYARQRGMPTPRKPFVFAAWLTILIVGVLMLIAAVSGVL
ncbi:hypothetical protein [Rhodopirellula sp. SWK7]|uniref:hypothetical protein n=1 Tax=Rhodopirellula sp. SWK7 TaxID=595460 RepID=UPI001360B55C|nr:hypothetical protein [Rhodopirellula sp. SWK7]